MTKGRRREKQVDDMLSAAGYRTYRPETTMFGDNDIHNLFDISAVHPDHHMWLLQVKSNRATGIRNWMSEVDPWYPMPTVDVGFAVCHDREGWRFAVPTVDGYEWIFDGRQSGDAMDEQLIELFMDRVPNPE